jgi:flagellar basal-body rod modification protein FlgD
MSTTSSVSSATTTANGTAIIPIGASNDALGQNAFLKILTAELSNQDPTQQTDSTAYVAQLAQFSSLEQMTNLNNSVSFSNAASLVGKTASVSDTDSANVPYTGVVLGVSKSGDTISLNMQVTDSRTKTQSVKQFNYNDLTDVADTSTTSTTSGS